MSRKMLTISATELRSVRVACQKCKSGAVIEVSFDQMDRHYKSGRCPLCQEPLSKDARNPIALLQDALEELRRNADLVDVSFILPADDGVPEK